MADQPPEPGRVRASDPSRSITAMLTFLTMGAVVAALYFGREVLVPFEPSVPQEGKVVRDQRRPTHSGKSPCADRLWPGRRLRDDCRHAFRIDVERNEGQRLAA
ncbi:MAG TPA: hypothetical protein VGI28_06925, partial [Stellaceae bacterium]